ncbi:MAG: PilZ domain-containing protein [Myxococcota bacterium]|nr:PilZ domain-containing protein [Myxococcota bacterium]
MGDRNERAFYRVQTSLPVRCRRVEPEEVLEFAVRTQESRDAQAAVPAELAAWAARIEDKLDTLLARLDPERPPPLSHRDAQSVVLSGSGMMLGSSDDLLPGDDVLLEFLLPGSPPRRVEALAQVVGLRRMDEAGHAQVAVRFGAIDEADRQAIVRAVYEVEVLSRRQNGDGAGGADADPEAQEDGAEGAP